MKRFKPAAALAVLFAGVLVLTATARSSSYSYSTLDAPKGVKGTYAYGINDSGDIVGYYTDSSGANHGFEYSGGSFTTIDGPGAGTGQNEGTKLLGINDSGVIVGYYVDSSYGEHGFKYSGGSFTAIDDPKGTYGTYPHGITDAGVIVGYYEDSSYGEHGFLDSGGSFTRIDEPNVLSSQYPYTILYGGNDSGDFVGSYSTSGSSAMYGFVYSGSSFKALQLEWANVTRATDINWGSDIVGYAGGTSSYQGFLYSGGSFTTIDDPNAVGGGYNDGYGTFVYGVNDNDDIVGYYRGSDHNYHGFLAAPIVNGACGSSDEASFTSVPTSNLCSSGTASSVTAGTETWSWSCSGLNGGTDASCSANRIVNGACGSSNGGSFTSAPASNLCSSGTASAVTGNGPWTWTWSCTGSNGGTSASCSASLKVNGACGSSNGGTFTSAPTSSLCSSGTASAVTGSGPWSWSCTGSNGGTSASCSAKASSTGGLWQNAKNLGSDWEWLSWFGYFSTNGSPWIYHLQLGWLYSYGSSTGSIWFYDSSMNAFLWTSATVYPYVYRASDGAWLWYDEGTSKPCWFYNYKTAQWEKD